MPHIYRCRECGNALGPSTRKHCREVCHKTDDNGGQHGSDLWPLILEMKQKISDMDRRVSNLESTITLRQNADNMSRATPPLARIRVLGEDNESAIESYGTGTGCMKSGSVMVATDFIVNHIDWPHMYVYRMTGGGRKGVPYAELRIEEFVFGFLSMLESPHCKMDSHTMTRILSMLMQDAMDFSWSNALAFYQMIGIDVECGLMDWSDWEVIQDMRFRYCRTIYPKKRRVRHRRKTPPKAAPAGMRCCMAYQSHACERPRDHAPFSHACSYCLRTCYVVCRHPEADCIRRVTDAANKGKKKGQY